MRILLFSIVAICIAGSRTQEIAIGTDYLRAHFNDSIALAINAQDEGSPPIVVTPAVNVEFSTSTTTTTIASTTDDDDNSSEKHDNKKDTKYDHEHKSHHEHDATISIDVHNILDLFKQQLQESEARIIAAIHPNQLSGRATALKSYRTADR